MFPLVKNNVYLNKQNVLYNVHIDESGYVEKSEEMCIISSVNNTHNIHNERCLILCIKWCIYGAYKMHIRCILWRNVHDIQITEGKEQ